MDVTVRIERLVLEGLDLAPGAADRVRAALAQALAEGLTERLAAGGRVDRVGPPTVPVTVPGPPGAVLSPGAAAALGGHAGRALAAGLTGRGGPA